MARTSPSAKMKSRKPLQAVSESTHKGGLHESLGIPLGQKIGAKRIAEAAKRGGKVGRQARLAQTYAKYRGGK